MVKRRRRAGFTLIEVVVGLALLGIATLVGLLALEQSQLAVERLEARHRALGEIEATLEAVRSGGIPLASGPVVPSLETTPGRERGLLVFLDVQPTGTADLYQVAATARWLLRGRPETHRVETMVYRP